MKPGAPDAARGWARELGAGAGGALAGLAPVLTLGVLAYAALGPAAAAVGIPAAFIAAVIGGSLFTLLARGPMAAGGPSSAPILMMAALVAAVVADPRFSAARPADMAALLALTAASVVATGLLQIGFALAGFAQAAKFVPQPVLAGFMNGVALLFIGSQIPTLLGWPAGTWAAQGLHALARIEPAALGIGGITVAGIWAWPRLLRWRRMPGRAQVLPATFVGLLLGCAASAGLAALFPAAPLGDLVGSLPRAWPALDRLAPWFAGDASGLLHRHAGTALSTALLIALIGTLDVVLNSLALDQAMGTRTAARHELLALGAANIVSGLAGGLPLQLVRARALATLEAGGRTRLAVFSGNGLFAMLALAGGSLLALLPQVVLAGIMVMVGLLMVDAWSLRLALQWLRGQRSAEARLNLVLVAVVTAVSVVFGLAIGVAVGAALAVAIFIQGMNRSLVRSLHSAAEQPSRRIHAAQHEAVLEGLRPRIAILELEGALFFGSADRLAAEADALDRACRAVVMDFKRVGLIDASGAVVLSQIAERLRERGVTLLLAGITAGDRHGRALIEFAGPALPTAAWHADVDRAVEAAELQALAEAGATDTCEAVPLSQSSLMAGLSEAQCALLLPCLERRSLRAGERLFAQGDPGDRLFVLTAGSISVVGGEPARSPGAAAGSSGGLRRRYITGSPGMMLGEIALLDGGGRSAEAVADTASEVFELSREALHRLGDTQPALCVAVYRNIALHLAGRLRVTSIAQNASL